MMAIDSLCGGVCSSVIEPGVENNTGLSTYNNDLDHPLFMHAEVIRQEIYPVERMIFYDGCHFVHPAVIIIIFDYRDDVLAERSCCSRLLDQFAGQLHIIKYDNLKSCAKIIASQNAGFWKAFQYSKQWHNTQRMNVVWKVA